MQTGAVSRNSWGKETLRKMAIWEGKPRFFSLCFPMLFDLPIYIYLLEFKKEAVLPTLKK